MNFFDYAAEHPFMTVVLFFMACSTMAVSVASVSDAVASIFKKS